MLRTFAHQSKLRKKRFPARGQGWVCGARHAFLTSGPIVGGWQPCLPALGNACRLPGRPCSPLSSTPGWCPPLPPPGSAVLLSLGLPVPSRTYPVSLRGGGGGGGLFVRLRLSRDVLSSSDLAGTLVLLPPFKGLPLQASQRNGASLGPCPHPPACSRLLGPWPDYRGTV